MGAGRGIPYTLDMQLGNIIYKVAGTTDLAVPRMARDTCHTRVCINDAQATLNAAQKQHHQCMLLTLNTQKTAYV